MYDGPMRRLLPSVHQGEWALDLPFLAFFFSSRAISAKSPLLDFAGVGVVLVGAGVASCIPLHLRIPLSTYFLGPCIKSAASVKSGACRPEC